MKLMVRYRRVYLKTNTMREKFTPTTHNSHDHAGSDTAEDWQVGPYVVDVSSSELDALGDLPLDEADAWKREQGIPDEVDVMTARQRDGDEARLHAVDISAEDFGTIDRQSTQAMERGAGDRLSEALEYADSRELESSAADYLRLTYGESATQRHQEIIQGTQTLSGRLAEMERAYGPEATSIIRGTSEQLRQETSGHRRLDGASFEQAVRQLDMLVVRQQEGAASLPRAFDDMGAQLMAANQGHDQRVRPAYEEAAEIDTRLEQTEDHAGVLASTIIESLGRDTLVNDATAEVFSQSSPVHETGQRGAQYAGQLRDVAQSLQLWADRAQRGEVQIAELRQGVEVQLQQLEGMQRGMGEVGGYAQALQVRLEKVKSAAFNAST